MAVFSVSSSTSNLHLVANCYRVGAGNIIDLKYPLSSVHCAIDPIHL